MLIELNYTSGTADKMSIKVDGTEESSQVFHGSGLIELADYIDSRSRRQGNFSTNNMSQICQFATPKPHLDALMMIPYLT